MVFQMRFLLLFVITLPAWGFRLSDQQEKAQVFRLDSKKNNILYLQSRIDLPDGEAWGQHCLKITLDQQPLKLFPLNKQALLYDIRVNPPQATEVCHSDGLYWLKADSDYACNNQRQPHIYSYGSEWELANATELNNRFFTYAFRIEANTDTVKVNLKIQLPEHQKQHPVEVSAWELLSLPDTFFFSRPWMQAVYQNSFPSQAEMSKAPELVLAGNQNGVAGFSIYNFQPFEGRLQLDMPGLPADIFTIYQVKNSLVEHKIKTAAEHIFLNIGNVQVPELWQPLQDTLLLEEGSSSFVLYACPKRRVAPGTYQGKLRLLDSSNTEKASCPVSLKILPFELPDHDDIPASFGLYIMAGGGDEQEIWGDLREHGITQIMLTPWGCPIKLQLDGEKLHADFNRLNQRLRFMQQFGINRRGLFYGTSEPLISSLKKLSGQTPGEAVFDRLFQDFIRLFFLNAEQQKIPVWLSLFDEANFKREQWDQTLLLTRLAKQIPQARMWATITELASAAYLYDTPGLYDAQDITMTHPATLIHREENEELHGSFTPARMAKELDKRFFWEYDGITSYPPGINRYAFGTRAWQLELKVLLGFAYWWGDMTKVNFTPKRNHYVTYPFLDKSTGQRSSTPGWEAIREGIDDYRLLHLAEKLLTQKYSVEEAQNRLAKYRRSPTSLPLTSDYYEQLRSQLITLILEAR